MIDMTHYMFKKPWYVSYFIWYGKNYLLNIKYNRTYDISHIFLSYMRCEVVNLVQYIEKWTAIIYRPIFKQKYSKGYYVKYVVSIISGRLSRSILYTMHFKIKTIFVYHVLWIVKYVVSTIKIVLYKIAYCMILQIRYIYIYSYNLLCFVYCVIWYYILSYHIIL